MSPTIGVLALQGDVREHVHALESCGARAVPVRRAAELAAVDGLVVPGGESTTIDKLLRAFDLFEPVQERLREGMPAYGSCAGMILMADRVLGGIERQRTLGGLDITVRRNAFGRQVDSFETDLDVAGLDAPYRAVFIRAPVVEKAGDGVEVLAEVGGDPVVLRDGPHLVAAFHPELTGEVRLHRWLLDLVAERGSR